MQSIIPSMVLQMPIMVQSPRKSLKNYGVGNRMTLQNRAGDVAKHHLLRGLSRSFISNRGCFRVLPSVTPHGALNYNTSSTNRTL